jgi:hypothetical protein
MTQLALLILSGAAVGLVTSMDSKRRILGCANYAEAVREERDQLPLLAMGGGGGR